MPRPPRPDFTGTVVHVLNRAARRATLFADAADHDTFERVLVETLGKLPLRILAFCVMPNHWHFVAWPRAPDELPRFMHRLTALHARRWHDARGTTGTGALYQGRYRAFPVEADGHVVRVCRYVERNALRAGLTARAEDWKWSSLWHRLRGDPLALLTPPPVELPSDWVAQVNAPWSDEELRAVRACLTRSAPFGSTEWSRRTARALGLESTRRSRGRPARRA